MFDRMKPHLEAELAKIRDGGLWKEERILASAQGPEVTLADGRQVLILCANNYLGLSSDPRVIAAAHAAIDARGYGLSSVRFICGTQDLHKTLELKIADFLGTEDTLLYAACFDANGGVFEPLLSEEDAIISDELNHASIIDGVRLCKAQRWRYKNNDMADLERCLKEAEAKGARHKLIATDGVFSMDGFIAKLKEICDLADRTQSLVMVDDCHATGFMGRTGRGSTEHCGVMGRVDIVTGTLGKALGGSLGGFTSGRREICASGPVPTCSRTRCRLPWSGPASRCSTCSRPPPSCATASRPTPGSSARGWWPRASRSSPARTRSSRSCSTTRSSPMTWRGACSTWGCTSLASRSRWCRGARRASGCRCRRPTSAATSSARSRPSLRWGRSSAS
jgi:hypothetical protein